MAHPPIVRLGRRFCIRSSGILVACLIWEITGRSMGESLLAPPSVVLPEFIRTLGDGKMLRELMESLRQMLVGYGLSCLIGIPLGVTIGRSRVCEVLLHPWLSMFVVTSAASLVPLFIVVLGTGFEFRVAIVFVASVGFPILTTYHGARGIDPRWIDVARSFRGSRMDIFWKVILPALYPYLITGARLGLVHAIRAMVVAEMYVVVGFGGLIYNSGLLVSTAYTFALLLALMIVSVLANGALRSVGRVLAPWHEVHALLP